MCFAEENVRIEKGGMLEECDLLKECKKSEGKHLAVAKENNEFCCSLAVAKDI